jgi:hypothetical protein
MLSDDEFVRQFEGASLDEFPHRDHVRLTIIYLMRHGRDQALERVSKGIRHFATVKGSPEKFHVTMTRAWLDLIESARVAHPEAHDAAALVAACPLLLDKHALLLFYSRERLESAEARAGWLPPDLPNAHGEIQIGIGPTPERWAHIMSPDGECRSNH